MSHLKSTYKHLCYRLGIGKDERPPFGTDWVGYETLIQFIESNGILSVPGDIVEIGTFLGGGAYKIAKFLEKAGSSKKLFVVDIFDPTFDCTVNSSKKEMKKLYLKALAKYKGKSQHAVFSEVTEGCRNIVVLAGDSKKLTVPSEKVCFAFIDGNHDPQYAENDFYLIWNKLSSNGAISFHDYGSILPQTTAKIDELIRRHRSEIKDIVLFKKKTILYIVKK